MNEEVFQDRDEDIAAYGERLDAELDYVFGRFLFGLSDDPRDITLDTLMLLLLDESGPFARTVQAMPFRSRAEQISRLVKNPPDSFTKGLADAQDNLSRLVMANAASILNDLAAKALTMSASGQTRGFLAAAEDLLASATRGLVDAFQNALFMWERIVLDKIAQAFAEEPKFIYAGPRDRKNREFCREIVGTPPRTRAEVEELNNHPALHYYVPPNVFILCGGHNCRHVWVPVAV